MIDIEMLAGPLAPADQRDRFYGVTVGLVTNNQDPDGLGRVKVKFPWLSEEHESHWARLLTPMAGNERGLYCLPEVDDEVLLAFEHGQAEFPYVLGALWNGQDKPPEQNEKGQNNKRTLKSRSGHVIRLDDTEGDEKIEIIDSSGQNQLVVSTGDNTITIIAGADITIQSNSGRLILEGQQVEIKSKAAMKIEAKGSLALKGSMIDIN